MKKFFKIIAIIFGVILVLLISLVQRIDRTPYQDTAHYAQWKEIIASQSFIPTENPVAIGWAKTNITPAQAIPMSGYGNRWGKSFETVLDSIYVGAISLVSSEKTISLVSADMLIIPPNVTEQLGKLLTADHISLNDIHLGATHTHHSIGSWGQKLIGRLFSGKYNPETEIHLSEKIREVILKSRENAVAGQVSYLESIYEEGIHNRLKLDQAGVKDPEMRNLVFTRSDSTKAVFLTYGAHSTVLPSRFLGLSKDYPGYYVSFVEESNEFDFALYSAGAVGSMGYLTEGKDDFERAENLGHHLAEILLQAAASQEYLDASDSLSQTRVFSTWIKVPLPDPSARISLNFALRPWIFAALFGEAQGDVKVTLINNNLVLGMPADFSGEIMVELDEYAKNKGLDLIITSFNGYYVGYITHDKWYENDLYETVTMSWNGYQAGNYYTEIAKDIIDKVASGIEQIN